MPKYDQETELKIKKNIRDILVLDPMIGVPTLGDTLFKRGFKTGSGNKLDTHYLYKLVKKIRGENINRADRQKLNERLADLKERYRLVYEKLVKIAFYSKELQELGMPAPKYKDQIEALNAITKLDLQILQAEMDAGVFERHLGKLDVDINVTEERKVLILKAFANFSLIPKQNDTVAATIKTATPQLPNGTGNNQQQKPAQAGS